MKYLFITILLWPSSVFSQQVTYSDYERQDVRSANFEVIGKMNNNFLVYKNFGKKHTISIYDNDMKVKENVELDFISSKTFNIDFITYPDFFYMIYQYQKKSILYCMAAKIDGNGKKMAEPFILDTTHISIFADNKIYNTISSEDKQKVMVFKIRKKNEIHNILTVLLDNQLQLIKKDQQTIESDEQRDNYGDFLLDNDGNFVFTLATQSGNRDYSSTLQLISKSPLQDTFAYHNIDLDKKYIDDVKLKVDNLNDRYTINSFYYTKSRGNIEGLFTYIWDQKNNQKYASAFTQFNDSLRKEAKSDEAMRFAFNDFFINQVISRKDGGFLLLSEDYSSQTRGSFGNPFNRWNYLGNTYSSFPNSYYYNNRYYRYYTPGRNMENTRYYYSNIMVLSIDKNGSLEWSKVIHKNQVDDNNDSFLSYFTMNSGGELHFLFNSDSKNQVIMDYSVAADASLKRNATLKSLEKGYEFMPRLTKQVGAKQLIVPCSYRGRICFAKIDF